MIRFKLIIVFVALVFLTIYLLLQNGSSDDDTSAQYSIKKGLKFLYNSYQADSSFALSGSLDETLQNTWLDHQIFLTPLFLDILNYVEKDGKAQLMKIKSLNLLMQTEENEGGWRYYIDSNNPLRNLIPPDADDTACVLYALIQHRKTYSKRSIYRLLKYRTKGGLFFTWLVDDPPLEQVVCIVVNANVLKLLCLLQEHEEDAKQLAAKFETLFEGEIQDEDIMSKTHFYATPYAFTHSLSKAYSMKPKIFNHNFIEKLKSFILNNMSNHSSGEPLETALAVTSLLNLGYRGEEVNESVNFLLQLQNENGSWLQHPFITSYIPVYDEELRKIVGQTAYFYSGSEELTTIICLEAIMKYKSIMVE